MPTNSTSDNSSPVTGTVTAVASGTYYVHVRAVGSSAKENGNQIVTVNDTANSYRSGVLSDIIYPKLLDICDNPKPAFTGMICRSKQPFVPHVDTVDGKDLNTISLLDSLTWATSDKAPVTIIFDQLNATEDGPMRIVASGDPEALAQYQKRHPDFRQRESVQIDDHGHGTFVMSDDLSTYIENPSTVPAVSPLLDFVDPVIRQKFSIKETVVWTIGEGFTWPSRQWHCSGSYSALGVSSKTWLLVKPHDVLK